MPEYTSEPDFFTSMITALTTFNNQVDVVTNKAVKINKALDKINTKSTSHRIYERPDTRKRGD